MHLIKSYYNSVSHSIINLPLSSFNTTAGVNATEDNKAVNKLINYLKKMMVLPIMFNALFSNILK